MLEASGSLALRTRMDGLRFAKAHVAVARDQRVNAVLRLLQRCFYAMTSGAADDVVAIEGGFERNRIVEIFAEVRSELPQLVQRKAAQFNALIERVANRVADFFVGGAERHALVYQIGGR